MLTSFIAAVNDLAGIGGAGGVGPILAVFQGQPVGDFDYLWLEHTPTVNDQLVTATWYALDPNDRRIIDDPTNATVFSTGSRAWHVAAGQTLRDCVPNLGDYLTITILGAADASALDHFRVRLTNRNEGAGAYDPNADSDSVLALVPFTVVGAGASLDTLLPPYCGPAVLFAVSSNVVANAWLANIHTREYNAAAPGTVIATRRSQDVPSTVPVALPARVNLLRITNATGAGISISASVMLARQGRP